MHVSNDSKPRLGWSREEDETLFALAKQAQEAGRPLRGVFERVAAETRRKPNSIRNYYYARIKQDGAGLSHHPAFRPFSREESVLLLEAVLSAQANGESVRACTLRLGNGDDRAMLRYQNKYRSLLRTNPALVAEVLDGMRARGKKAIDPYAVDPAARRSGRPRKTRPQLAELADTVVADLAEVKGLDVAALLEALGRLAVSAVEGSRQSGRADQELLERLEQANARADESHERFMTLLGYFRQLVRVNTEFLKMNSVVKVSNLSNYIRDLESSVRSCEPLIVEY